MSSLDSAKLQAARAAVSFIQDGMIVGLGTGSTAAIAIDLIGERCRTEGLKITGVPTSDDAARRASHWQIPLLDLNDCDTIDLTIDGADEVDSEFRMVKGRGGALLREKLVAAVSRRRIYIVDPSKRVGRLGLTSPVPVEVAGFDVRHTANRLRALGAEITLRLDAEGRRFTSDGGNALLDCQFGLIDDPEQLDAAIKGTLGVYETGLFLGFCDTLIVGTETDAQVISAIQP